MERMKILIFGNPLLENDSIPLKISKKLQNIFPNIEFKELDSLDDIEKEGKNLIIIDTVEGIKDITLFEGIDQFEKKRKIFTMHDFDLSYVLSLLKKIGKVNRIRIIGVPPKIKENTAIKKISEIIPTLF